MGSGNAGREVYGINPGPGQHEDFRHEQGVSLLEGPDCFRDAMNKLRFLVSLHSCENDFQVAQAQCAEDTARRLGIDVEIVFAEDDAVNQSTQLLKAIQSEKESRPDAIVLEPVGGTALPQVAKAANAAGIGWAVLNRRPEYLAELRKQATAPIFAVSADHDEIGRIQGKQFAGLLPRGGSVLYIEGPSRSSSAGKRTAGMLETKPSNIRVSMLKASWTEESAARTVLSWLKLSTSQSAPIERRMMPWPWEHVKHFRGLPVTMSGRAG